MPVNKLLVAGVKGQIGARVARHFAASTDWDVVGLSRSAQAGLPPEPDEDDTSSALPQRGPNITLLAVDLLDAQDTKKKLQGVEGVTHAVYAARYPHSGGAPESVENNFQMFANFLSALEDCPTLRHVHLVHGTKYYGHGIAPGRTPYTEDLPRHDRPLFYYPQQDYLEETQRKHDWTWSISRPHAFCDRSVTEPRSITLLIAVYASILKELGEPLHFPGTVAAFQAQVQFTWLPNLARAVEWMMSEPACENEAFNVVNGDPMKWARLWGDIADYFDMEWTAGAAISLRDFGQTHTAVWHRMITKYNLRPSKLPDVVQWAYGDYVFAPQWDVVSSMEKAHSRGFSERVDTIRMWRENFDRYRRAQLIP